MSRIGIPAIVSAALLAAGGKVQAQSSTSASIGGRILDHRGRAVQGAGVTMTNTATGIVARVISHADGRYLISGLDVGGPYSLAVRRIGWPMARKSGLYLSIGQQLRMDVILDSQTVMLPTLEINGAGEPNRIFSRGHMGTEALLSDSILHQLPVLNRDLYDLVRLVPQMSTWFALTAAGAGPRSNSIRLDGVTDQVPASNLAAGQIYGGKVIPLDAVKEYQVAVSPYDVRQGSFAGAGVNVVTRSGTNELQGSVYGYGTNEQLGPNVPLIRNARYEKEQFGLSLGGPIIRDRLLFFASSELQQRSIPAVGPFIGQSLSSGSSLGVSPADIARFQQLLTARGLDAGSAGPVTNPNPSSSTFFRVDAPVARWNSRVAVRASYGRADSSIFARPTMLTPTNCSSNACFPLSSLQHSRWLDKRSASVELATNFAGGTFNELVAGGMHLVTGFHPTVDEPLILVNVPGTGGVPALLQAGTHEIATGQKNINWSTEITDNLSFSAGRHRITVGVSSQLFDLWAFQLRGSYGVWEFASLDSLQSGVASRYRITRDTGSVTAASGGNHAAYAGDDWELSPRLSVTLGLRADLSTLSARPPYVAAVDSIFHLRTDAVPATGIEWSPRLGFNYDLTSSDGVPAQVRGGVGLFTGRPPLFWLFGGFAAYGLATRTLQCGTRAGDAGPPPAFRPNFRDPPLACAGGQSFGSSTTGEIDVIDRRLRSPQSMRASLAVDRTLPLGMLGTIEGLYTRTTQAVFFSPINLGGAVAVDRHGRRMYGALSPTGMATPTRVAAQLGDVVSITNQAKDNAYDVTGALRKETRSVDLALSVSVGHARDVESPRTVSALLTDNWRFARPVAGNEDALTPGTSDFDQPYRVRASGTLRSPWRTLPTELSFFYVGGSGFPYTYVAGGAPGRGDLNADGAVGNDPIYLPTSVYDTSEVRFAGSPAEVATQQAAFDRLIERSACLRTQRGRIMSRNSCRSPWMNVTNLAVRQTLSHIGSHFFTFEIEVFNFLNLLNAHWGRLELPTGSTLATTSQIPLLSQVGETAAPDPQPIYRLDSMMPQFGSENFDSYYQIQLAVRYSF
ncbi:MAG TPA: TonB-dependent receptor [Gemmatimonadaceae bacterium]